MDIASARAARSRIVADVFDSHDATVTPMVDAKSVNAIRGPDPDRDAFVFKCSISFNPPPDPGPRSPAGAPALANDAVYYEAAITAYDPGDWPYQPRRGDQVSVGSVPYEIANIGRDGAARKIYYVNRARP